MTKRLSLILMIGSLMCLGLPACGEEEPEVEVEAPGDDPVDEVEEEITEEQIEQEMEEEAEEGGEEMAAAGGSACERAQSCCTAYVEIMAEASPAPMNAETVCASVQNATGPTADTICQTQIDSWRQGLEAMNREVPESCAAGS
jgi:hypothetical protein